jgi:hypothetical protein
MSARDLLGVAIRAFGVYVAVHAALELCTLVVMIICGDVHGASMFFTPLLSAILPLAVGIFLMKRADQILGFMNLPRSGASAS